MTNPKPFWASQFISLISLLFLPLVLSCGDGGAAPTDPDDKPPPTEPPTTPDPVQAVISGPAAVILDCSLHGTGTYTSSQSTGTISEFGWRVDGLSVGKGASLDYAFKSAKDYEVALLALDSIGAVLDADTLKVSASPPTDLSACLSSSRIEGRWGVLRAPGSPPISSPYTLKIPDAIPSGTVNYSWRLSFEGGDPVEIASGIDLDIVGAQFPQGGEYLLSVEFSVGGSTQVSSLRIRVREGEAVAEPGKILVFVESEVGQDSYRRVHFMDGETGFLSDPILTVTNNFLSGRCTSERIVFTMGTTDNSSGSLRRDLFTMNHDGTEVKRIVNAEFGLEDPDPKQNKVLFLTGTRTGTSRPEAAIYDFDTGIVEYLVDPPRRSFSPTWPAFGESPEEFAGGNIPFDINGEERFLVVRYWKDGPNWFMTRLHDFTSMEAYGWEEVREGTAGVAWDPRNELVAYVASRMYAGGFYQGIAVAAIDGSSVKLVTEGNDVLGNIRFTPSGSHIMFHKTNSQAPDQHGHASAEIVMVPRDGGPVVNLTRATVPQGEHVVHFAGGYCSG